MGGGQPPPPTAMFIVTSQYNPREVWRFEDMAIRSFNYGPFVVWTDGDTTVYHPLTPPIETRNIKSVRISLEMCQSTGGITVTPSLDLSNDGVSWGSSSPIQNNATNAAAVTLSADGVTYDDEFVDLSATVAQKRLARIGVSVANSGTTGNNELARISLQIETKES